MNAAARWSVLGAFTGALAGGGAWLAANDPSAGGVLPPCPFLALTGLWCPGCGSGRCLHALLHGDVAAAFGWNPLAAALLPLVAAGLVLEARAFVRPGSRRLRVPPVAARLLLGAIVLFGVVRNLPFGPFPVLAPH